MVVTQHHQGDAPLSWLTCWSTGTEKCVVVVALVVSLMFSLLNLEAVVEVVQTELAVGGWPARHGTSIRWARLVARTFGHRHRAVCGADQFEVVEARVLADSLSRFACRYGEPTRHRERRRMQIEQTRRAPEGGACGNSPSGVMLLIEDTTAGIIYKAWSTTSKNSAPLKTARL